MECYSGISGDMFLGAMLDLGIDDKVLREELKKLPIDGYEIYVGREYKNGIEACGCHVKLTEDTMHESKESVNEDSAQGCHIHENHEHGQRVHGMHEHGQGVHGMHEHGQGVHGMHEHGEGVHGVHTHEHEHRTFASIRDMIQESSLNESVKARAIRIFRILAQAEAKVHGRPVEEVAFHEVGAVDSIVDIVGAAICMEYMEIDHILVSPMYEGQGHIWCQHGKIPVPVPAVLELATAHRLPIHITEIQGEMITPTGAAIVAACRDPKLPLDDYTIEKIGMGAGEKDFPHANILRAMLLSPKRQVLETKERVWVLESNVDDCSGEQLGYTIDRLMQAGALDACCIPLCMKKHRPGYMLQVLCQREKIEEMESIIFHETTSIGLRKYEEARTVLSRRVEEVSTPYGAVKVKVCVHKGEEFCYPEYSDIHKICDKTGMSYREAYSYIREHRQKRKSNNDGDL